MPHSRQRPRIASTGRVTIRLTTAQRTWLEETPATPQHLRHLLHRAVVKEGKLTIRVDRADLDALIAAGAAAPAPDSKTDRELDALLRYLETQAARFVDDADVESP